MDNKLNDYRLCMYIFMHEAKKFCRRLLCVNLYDPVCPSVGCSVGSSIFHNFRRAQETYMFLSEDVWRKSGMGKGKGQYVLWDGETKRGYDRLRGHCILGAGKGEGVDVEGEMSLSHTYVYSYTVHIKSRAR